jgi:hypothetical protein
MKHLSAPEFKPLTLGHLGGCTISQAHHLNCCFNKYCFKIFKKKIEAIWKYPRIKCLITILSEKGTRWMQIIFNIIKNQKRTMLLCKYVRNTHFKKVS